MSVLSEVNAANIVTAAQGTSAANVVNIPPELVAAVRAEVNSVFWKWYENNKDNHVATVHFWLFSKDVKVSDLQQVFILLFGAEGEDQTVSRPLATLPPDAQ